jgi:hypothetical protein
LNSFFNSGLNRSIGGDLSHFDSVGTICRLPDITAICMGWQTPTKGDSGGYACQPKSLLDVTHVFTPHNVNQD